MDESEKRIQVLNEKFNKKIEEYLQIKELYKQIDKSKMQDMSYDEIQSFASAITKLEKKLNEYEKMLKTYERQQKLYEEYKAKEKEAYEQLANFHKSEYYNNLTIRKIKEEEFRTNISMYRGLAKNIFDESLGLKKDVVDDYIIINNPKQIEILKNYTSKQQEHSENQDENQLKNQDENQLETQEENQTDGSEIENEEELNPTIKERLSKIWRKVKKHKLLTASITAGVVGGAIYLANSILNGDVNGVEDTLTNIAETVKNAVPDSSAIPTGLEVPGIDEIYRSGSDAANGLNPTTPHPEYFQNEILGIASDDHFIPANSVMDVEQLLESGHGIDGVAVGDSKGVDGYISYDQFQELIQGGKTR